jgi:nucleoside-diphosphate-sugar epimerase
VYNIASGSTVSMRALADLIASYRGTTTISKGDDINESDRWEICIHKASAELGYRPQYTSTDAVKTLLDKVL